MQSVLDMDHGYKRSTELVTLIDNHDMPRFLSVTNTHENLELATILLLTLRGIPAIFYGTEQYLVNHTHGGQDPCREMCLSWAAGIYARVPPWNTSMGTKGSDP